MRTSGRVLAVDYGTKRIGLAIADPTGVMALALPVVEIPSRERERAVALTEIRRIVKEKEVGLIVVGLPLNTDDTEGPRAKETREFAGMLEHELGVPVELFDERYTTQQAESMLHDVPLSRKKKRRHLNAVAAQVILESYLSAVRCRG